MFIFILFRIRLDASSDLMSVHIGDRLLEVNGLPVKGQPLEKIESLLRSPESTLQVMRIPLFTIN